MTNDDIKRLKDAEDIIWSIINSYGYKNVDDAHYKLALEYFDKYGHKILEKEDEDTYVGPY